MRKGAQASKAALDADCPHQKNRKKFYLTVSVGRQKSKMMHAFKNAVDERNSLEEVVTLSSSSSTPF